MDLISPLAAWVHDLDPRAVGPVRWYGLSYLLGFAIAWFLARRVAKVGRSPLSPLQVGDLVLSLALGVVIGGRLGYVLFYEPSLLWRFTTELPFWGLLAINQGGMASHGGMVGGVAACGLFAWYQNRRQDEPIRVRFLLDLLAFGAPLGLFFGRLANFVNGELIGRRAPEGLPWAVKFPQEIRDWDAERLLELGPAAEQIGVPPSQWEALIQQAVAADPEAAQSLQYYLHQLITSVQAGTPTGEAVKAALEPVLTPRHPSQIYAGILEGLVVFAVLAWLWAKPRGPGLVASVFAITYGVGRIVNELFRRPDVHLLEQEFALLGITRGQWLSVILVGVGLWGLWYVRRRPLEAMGAWRRGPWTGGGGGEPAERG